MNERHESASAPSAPRQPARRALAWLWTIFASAVLLLGSAHATKPGGPSPQAIRLILGQSDQVSAETRGTTLAALSDLGTEAIPALLEVFTGRDLRVALDTPKPPAWRQQVLLEALEQQDAEEVARALTQFALRAELEERLLCLQVATQLRGNRAVNAWVTLVNGIAPTQFSSNAVSTRAEEALTKIVSEAPLAVKQIGRRIDAIQPRLHATLARAVSRGGAVEALPVLSHLYGETVELDLIVLREAGRVRASSLHKTPQSDCGFLSTAMQSEDSRYRSEAVVALARLRCKWAVDSILDALRDDDARVVQAAHWSLKHLSGHDWGPGAKCWTAWWSAEQAWFGERFETLAAAVDSTDTDAQLEAVDEFGAHRIYADPIRAVLEKPRTDITKALQQRIEWVLNSLDRK